METIIDRIKSIDVSSYPRMWCDLNSRRYPKELKDFEPRNWELLPATEQFKLINVPFDYITSIVSEKDLLREWNKDMFPGVEFDLWWENREDFDEKFASPTTEKMYDNDQIKVMIQEAKAIQKDMEKFVESLIKEFPGTTFLEAQSMYFLLQTASQQNQIDALQHDISTMRLTNDMKK